VPDEIIQAPEIPRTLSGKKQEVPLKKLFLGHPPEKIINREVMANPQSVDWYLAHCASRSSPS
jgi:acetoacetyl-CoA synthetase